MMAEINDAAALRSLSPIDVATYLRTRGWKLVKDLPGRSSLWLSQIGSVGEADITLPARRDMGDYTLRMSEILSVLADTENRSQLDVFADLQNTGSDLIRMRAPTRDAGSGSLPLSQALHFVEKSRDLMLAAACAEIKKKPVFAKRKPQQAMAYLDKVRMGQTERGSFVLTILSPAGVELKQLAPEHLKAAHDPYERRVVTTLMQSLSALRTAAELAAPRGDMEPFQAAINLGVSANLCEAVVGLSEASPELGFDIHCSWSRGRPVEAQTPSKTVFTRDNVAIIAEASSIFREYATFDDFEVEGVVVRLNRAPLSLEGDVTIYGNVDDTPRYILVKLEADDYAEACIAHDNRLPVYCTGDLVKEGRGYRLLNPRSFGVEYPE